VFARTKEERFKTAWTFSNKKEGCQFFAICVEIFMDDPLRYYDFIRFFASAASTLSKMNKSYFLINMHISRNFFLFIIEKIIFYDKHINKHAI